MQYVLTCSFLTLPWYFLVCISQKGLILFFSDCAEDESSICWTIMHEFLFAESKEVGCYWYMVHEKELWLQLKAQPKYVQGMSVTMSSYHQLKMEHSKIRGNIGRMTQLLHWLGINWTASWQHVASLSFLVFCDCKFNSSLPLLDKWNRKVEWFLFCEACSNLPNLFFMFRLPTLCCSTYENVLLAY
jgi:hypothetical protein